MTTVAPRAQRKSTEAGPLGFVPALDGIRAIAILGVVINHTGVRSGGQGGVTLFFVLSGFLITTILLQERRTTGAIHLRYFYVRRVGRLYPVLIAAVAVGVVLSAASGFSAARTVQGAGGTLFYSINIMQAIGGIAPWAIFGWAWSLSLEEQFYFLWPPLLRWINVERRRAAILVGLGLLAVLSTAARIALAPHHVDLAYHAPFTRIDAIAVGAMMALVPTVRRLPAWTGWIGALAVLGIYALGSSSAIWVGWGTLLLVACAVPLVAVASQGTATALGRLLSLAPVVFAGRISYALYLWDSLLYEFFRARGWGSHLDKLAVIIMAVSLAALSTMYFEEPVRRRVRARFTPRPGFQTEGHRNS